MVQHGLANHPRARHHRQHDRFVIASGLDLDELNVGVSDFLHGLAGSLQELTGKR